MLGNMRNTIFAGLGLLALAACTDAELGADLNDGYFGNSTMNNTLVQSGERSYAIDLSRRFSSEIPSTVNFAFNSSQLDGTARAALMQQADWIKQFPEVRFRVYGHTDLVGGQGFNKALGMRRAQAVVSFLSAQGISRSRLEAVVSYGETQPLIMTEQPELKNRRTVTEVSGFVAGHPTILNGKYAQVVFREYLNLGKRPHPTNTVIETQTNPGG